MRTDTIAGAVRRGRFDDGGNSRVGEIADAAVLSPFRSRRAAVLTVLAVAIGAYLDSLPNGFVFDDVRKIVADARVQHVDLPELFGTSYWGSFAPQDVTYRPLVNLSYALTHAVVGLAPLAYHVGNVALHGLNSVLVLFLAGQLFGRLPPALAAALAFAVHPIHTEAVANVVGRAELMSFGFAVVSLLAFRRGRAGRGAAWWTVSLLAYLLALLSKESAVLLPAMILLWELVVDRRPRAPRSLWPYAGLLGVLALLFVIRKVVVGAFLVPAPSAIPLDPLDRYLPLAHLAVGPRLLTAVLAFGRYVALLLYPVHLCGDYSYAALPEAHTLTAPGVAPGFAAVALVAATSAATFVWSPVAFWSIAVFVLALLPNANVLFPVSTVLAERLLYFPSLGFCLVLASVLAALPRSRFAWAAFALLLAAYAVRTVTRNPDWREEERFWEITVAACPHNAKALYNRGKTLMDHWKSMPVADPSVADRAERAFEQALAIDPYLYRAHLNLGVIHSRRQEHDQSEESYRRAAAVAPAAYEPWVDLGYDYLVMGDAAAKAGRAGEARERRLRALEFFAEAEKRLRPLATSGNSQQLRDLDRVRQARAAIEAALQ